MNGFATYLASLAEAFPHIVESLLGDEFDRQVQLIEQENYLPLLQDLSHAAPDAQMSLGPRVRAALAHAPSIITEQAASRWSLQLNHMLQVLQATAGELDRKAIAEVCARRYESAPNHPLALVWLRGLFTFDLVQGTEVLVATFSNSSDPSTSRRALDTFAGLFWRTRNFEA